MGCRTLRILRDSHAWILCLLILSLLNLPVTSHAQVTASITGVVTDPSGKVVDGAEVTVQSLETGATRTTQTDESGTFRVLALTLGQEQVIARKNGFQDVTRTVDLEVGQEAVLDLKLALRGQNVNLVVNEEAPVVNTTTSPVAGMVDERQIKDLPLNGRSFDALITLNPGTINYDAMKSANTSTSNGNTFSVDGRRTGENLFLLNGVEYMGSSQLAVTPGGTSGYLLGVDGIVNSTS